MTSEGNPHPHSGLVGHRRNRPVSQKLGSPSSSLSPTQVNRRLDRNLLPRSFGSFGSSSSSSSRKMMISSRLGNNGISIKNNNASMSSNGFIRSSSFASFNSSQSISSCGSGGSSLLFKANAAIQIAQRSNGSAVKQVIRELQQITYDHEDHISTCERSSDVVVVVVNDDDDIADDEDDDIDIVDAPVAQIAILAQWSSLGDAYYKVIITKYDGIPIILKAMKAFPANPDIQTYGCMALQHLNNKMLIQQHDGLKVIMDAMSRHKTNISVQSEALLAIQCYLVGQQQQDLDVVGTSSSSSATSSSSSWLLQDDDDVLLLSLLEHAKDMFLTIPGKDACMFLLKFFQHNKGTSSTTTTTKMKSPTTVRECVSGFDLGAA